jgi:D-alanyl-D-alanine carboxypeptidase
MRTCAAGAGRPELRRAPARGPLFAPGRGWAYSNAGYLLLRQILDGRGGLAAFLPALGFAAATVAEARPDFGSAVPARSALIGDGQRPVAGRYHPGWVGHRTMVTSARELHRSWSTPPPAFADRANLVPAGAGPDGFFAQPSCGLGVMADPGSPIGLIIGHGGGPGYPAGAFTAPGQAAVAIVVEATEDFPAGELAVELLKAAACAHP